MDAGPQLTWAAPLALLRVWKCVDFAARSGLRERMPAGSATRVAALVNAELNSGADNQPQASSALHVVLVCCVQDPCDYCHLPDWISDRIRLVNSFQEASCWCV